MLNRLVLIIALGFAALASPAANAADWFSQVEYGRVDYNSSGIDPTSTYGVGFGVFFNDYVGAQLDWGYIEQPDVAPCPPSPPLCLTAVFPSHRIALRALGRLPLGDRFELIGGFGRLRYSNGAVPNSDQDADLISFGAGWRINETFTLGIQREVASTEFGAPDVDIDTLTLRYRF